MIIGEKFRPEKNLFHLFPFIHYPCKISHHIGIKQHPKRNLTVNKHMVEKVKHWLVYGKFRLPENQYANCKAGQIKPLTNDSGWIGLFDLLNFPFGFKIPQNADKQKQSKQRRHRYETETASDPQQQENTENQVNQGNDGNMPGDPKAHSFVQFCQQYKNGAYERMANIC